MEKRQHKGMGHNQSRGLRNAAMNQLLKKRYQFVKTLGTDPWGGTYLVADTHIPGHPLCVAKQLKLPINHSSTLGFSLNLLKKKAQTLKNLGEYPQIPKILSYFEEQKSFYLIEEHILGQSLAQEILPGRILPESEVITLLQEILTALVLLHNHGVIHHRLKPSKLIRRQSDGRLCLTGFGIFLELSNKMLQSQRQKTQAETNGSAIYISPEQNLGQPQFNSDLYAVGMIAIQALTGRTNKELSKLKRIGEDSCEKESWHNHIHLNPWFINLLNKMVHEDSKQRYQLAQEVLDDLETGEGQKIQEIFSQPLSNIEETSQNITLRSSSPASPPPSPLSPPKPQFSPPPLSQKQKKSPGLVPKFWIMAGGAIVGLLLLVLWSRLPQRVMSTYWVNQGMGEEEEGTTQQAIKYYTQAIEMQPQNSNAYYQRGLIYQRLGDREAALEDLTQAIALNPRFVEAYYQRGNTRVFLGDNSGAIADYSQALEINPEYIKAYVNRGSILADQGDEKRAIEDYTEAIRLDENLAAAFLNRCLSRSNIGDQQGAIADCTQAINLRPTHSFAYQNRGVARARNGDIEGAIADYNTAIKLAPEDPEPYYNRGVARQDLGEIQGAILDYTTAIEHNKNHALAYYDRAIAYASLKEVEKAKADFEKSSILCLDLGRLECAKDAQYQLKQLEQLEQ